MHTPVFKENKDTDRAVVFIHGFMGSPDQFAGLAKDVYKDGCSCMSVLLPGHGVGVNEFVKFGVSDWERHVQGELDKIRSDYKKIYLVGHSMGGLLALNASLERKNNIAGVVLLSTPLRLNYLSVRAALKRLRLLMSFYRDDGIKSAYISSASISRSKFFYYPLVVMPVMNLYKLIRKTKKLLPEVFVPVCMFHSKNDETVSYKSAALLSKGLRGARVRAFSLGKSWHAFYCEDERELIRDAVIGFVRGNE